MRGNTPYLSPFTCLLRQLHRHLGALAHNALNADGPTLSFNQRAGDEQPLPQPSHLPLVDIPDGFELVKQGRQRLLGNPAARIEDLDVDFVRSRS